MISVNGYEATKIRTITEISTIRNGEPHLTGASQTEIKVMKTGDMDMDMDMTAVDVRALHEIIDGYNVPDTAILSTIEDQYGYIRGFTYTWHGGSTITDS